MANNYTQFSFAIPKITPEEAEWTKHYLGRLSGSDTQPPLSRAERRDTYLVEAFEHSDPGFQWEFDQDGLWIYAEEAGTPEMVGAFIQRFLKRHRPTSFVSFTWSDTCSKMRLDEFSGGAVLITATHVSIYTPYQWIERERTRLAKRGITEVG